ncbi:MAG: cyanophycin synthetase [Legionella sp.]|nr:cyanophycin synthetase [Legionella sp.]
MKILNLAVLRGPNYWSQTNKKLIVLKLDIADFESTVNTKSLPRLLKKTLPSLYVHNYAWLEENNFFKLEKGTCLSTTIAHVAMELQYLAGMESTFQKVVPLREKGQYHIVFSFETEKAGIFAAKAAVKIITSLSQGLNYLTLLADIKSLIQLYHDEKLGPSTSAITQEAQKRGIPWRVLEDQPFVSLGYGKNHKKLWMTVLPSTSSIGVETVADKDLTKRLLTSHLIPTPQGCLVSSQDEFEKMLPLMDYPLAIKPSDGNHGNGVTCNIKTYEEALASFHLAKNFSKKVIIETFVEGQDYRFLVINFKLVAVAQRRAAQIIGSGDKTIEELINEINQDPKRGPGHENFLTMIKVDEITKSILKNKQLTLKSILDKNEILILKYSANISAGGTAIDVTDEVHPFNRNLAERIAKITNLDICGIDAIIKNIHLPMDESNSAILEVNAAPGLRMHLLPSEGKPRQVAKPILDLLYPPGKNSKIPIIAVTGTNGKTTVVRLIAHLGKTAKHHVGFTTTEGIYINDEIVYKGDCSGPLSANVILYDPDVDFAVLECARGGIIRSGLGFDHCDVSIITNITEDHIGLKDIHSLDDLTKVKAVVAYSTHKDGVAILNADDDRVYALKDNLECQIALFALTMQERISLHCKKGGIAAFVEDDWVVIRQQDKNQRIAKLKDIPLSFNGKAECMVKNILPAVIAGVVSGFSLAGIIKGLKEFLPSEQNTPGRMNLYEFENFKIMLDYAHNEAGYIEIKKYLDSLHCAKKIGIISATGDRRAQDIQKLGTLSAQMFDEIIIKHSKDGRGSSNDHLSRLLIEGVHAFTSEAKVKVISDEYEALNYALDNVIPNTFIFYAIDDVFDSLKHMKNEILKRGLDS